ncbi:MAG: mechanosensitive ion channel domain-containing protein [Jannaschia helgolandensis]|jgi:small conductance mechanosensitive channel|uniref:Small-conductance mechanosensitive channel n=1 Tax=Jannaschia helgolandensis TaxID=188906 RepID=A0A1H7G2S1_9RHOB|nr:mechanosensitive ion channel domain-containing protein [Jannaschia helgolandensis]SEK29985.1 small conductance mechanosensitive channel [Jannaschia helgolandensis]|tara:strand:- start:1347 stop:2195 length:849 start_codon:yes stop_codon:yes gene_type:complete
MNELLSTEVYAGRTLGDFISFDYLAGILGNVLSAIVVLVIGLMVAGWVAGRISGLSHRHKRLDDTLFDFLANLARYAIIGLSFLIVLNTFGIQTTSLVAVIGAAGLAIGLALQGTLSNVAAGVMLIFFRPIKLGDFVTINGESGTVKAINLNFTELASIGNVQIIIPNSEVWGNTITNYSAYDTRQAEWTFGVGYSANLDTVEQVIRDTISADPRFLADPPPTIKVTELGASSVDFMVRAWVPRTEFFAYWKDMNREVKLALDAAGVEIPFPNRTVHIVKDD